MNRHTVEKRVRGLRCGVLVGRSANLKLPGSILVGRRRQALSLPDEDGVRNMFLEILLSDVYGLERRGRDAFPTVLDIGANVGLFAVAARKTHRHAVIHAYEPNLELERYLSVQLRVAGATWFREAVGGERSARPARGLPGRERADAVRARRVRSRPDRAPRDRGRAARARRLRKDRLRRLRVDDVR